MLSAQDGNGGVPGCTPHKRTLFGEGKRGVQPRLFCILGQGVSGCETFVDGMGRGNGESTMITANTMIMTRAHKCT